MQMIKPQTTSNFIEFSDLNRELVNTIRKDYIAPDVLLSLCEKWIDLLNQLSTIKNCPMVSTYINTALSQVIYLKLLIQDNEDQVIFNDYWNRYGSFFNMIVDKKNDYPFWDDFDGNYHKALAYCIQVYHFACDNIGIMNMLFCNN